MTTLTRAQPLTRAQREALYEVYRREVDNKQPCDALTYLQFRRRAFRSFVMDHAVMVPFAGMLLGIETDGYTHS